MNKLYTLAFIIAMQSSFIAASWQIGIGVELHDTQLHGFSVGVQTSNALSKKLYVDSVLFKLCYDQKSGLYCNAELDEHKEKKSKKHTGFHYAAQSFTLALLKEATFCINEVYKKVMQKSPSDINVSSINRYNRAAIPFESITNNVINGFIRGVVPDSYVKEVYHEVQKALENAKAEQKKGFGDFKKSGKPARRLVMINGKLSFYDHTQELLNKINTLEELARRLKNVC